MKILMATMGLDIGGAETHIVELAKELHREGHEIIVASNGGVYVPEIEAAGITHVKIPMHRRNPWLMLRSLIKLSKLIRKERPDIVHAHARIPAFLCGIVRKTVAFPFVTTAHWVFDTGGALRVLTNWGEKTIAVSDDIRDYLTENYNVKREDIFVTINGIDTEKFSPAVSGEGVRKEFGIPADAPVVSHVSRLDESRALAARFLIETAPSLARRVPGVVLLITGGGDVFDELKARADEVNIKLGRSCVVMAGPRTNINEMCAAGDVFVGVSRAALEAMAVGLPTLIAGNEGTMGIFDEPKLQIGIDGNFCCRGCPEIERETFLDDLTTLLTLPSEEKERLAAYGRRVVSEHYSVGRMARDAMAAYTAALPVKQVLLSGYYGYGNAGDEAILTAINESVLAECPTAQVTVLSNDPKKTMARHRCRAVRRFSLPALIRETRRCDVLISGGGSLFQDTTSTRSLLYYVGVIRLAKRAGKKVILYANGIGPLKRESNRRRVRKVVELADVVTLRDPDSLQELREMGITREDITVTADPAFMLEPSGDGRALLREMAVPEAPYIAVSVRPWKGAPDFYEKFAGVCSRIGKKYDMPVVLAPMQPSRDEPVSWDLRDKMDCPAYVLSGDHDPRELMGVIGGASLVLSMRLHALIFAACTATPALGFVYDPKVESYLQMLGQPSAGSTGELDEDAAVAAASVLLDRREEVVPRLIRTRDRITAAAHENDELLREILK